MKITKHEVDDEGLISISNCVRLLTMGIRNNIVTIWAVTKPGAGILMDFVVKSDDESITATDCQEYLTSFINTDGVWHLFGRPPKSPPPQPPQPPPMNPKGLILTQ